MPGDTTLPLAGYRVTDLGWVWAGPAVGQILADMGAEVIKVESRKRLDLLRTMGRPVIDGRLVVGSRGVIDPEDEKELTPIFHNVNRNKRGIAADLQHPQAVALVKELIKQSDVVIENFAPGALRRMGLDYETLRALKPDIVMISMSAAGQWGPLAETRAYAPTLTCLAGMESIVGYEGEGVQGMLTFGISDPSAAVHGALAVLAALYHRRRTGEGQYIDMSQLEATVALLGTPVMDYFMNGRVAGPQGNRDPLLAPYGNYPCLGTEAWISIAVASDEQWRHLCAALGEPEWAGDGRFATTEARQRHRAALDRLIATRTANYDKHELAALLQQQGVAAAPVLSVEEGRGDPHFQARELYLPCDHPMFGPGAVVGSPWHFSETPGAIRRHAPLLGQDNQYVYGELLGLPGEEIERLVAAEILY